MKKESILVSACLLGIPCRYDGEPASSLLAQPAPAGLKDTHHLVPVCPEQLGGLPTPRKPVEITGGDGSDVLEGTQYARTEDGDDFTEQFIAGAKQTFAIAQITGAAKMITQKNSPSCGAKHIYDGSFSRTKKKGMGVCSAYLKSKGLALVDIDDLNSA